MALFTCQECAKTFSRRSNLERHMGIHLGLKMFACDVCSKQFKQKSNLQRHTASCTSVSEAVSKVYTCEQCQKEFAKKSNLKRHMDTHTPTSNYWCEECSENFSRKDNYVHHMRNHENPQYTCVECDEKFCTKQNLCHHEKVFHAPPPASRKRKAESTSGPSKRVKLVKEALNNTFVEYVFLPTESTTGDLLLFLEEVRSPLTQKLTEEYQTVMGLKWYTLVQVQLSKVGMDGVVEYTTPHFRSLMHTLLREDMLPSQMDEAFAKILRSFEEFMQRGSGWTLDHVIKLDLHRAKYRPLSGSSYIPLPKDLADKKALLNIQNEDQKCFLWCLLAYKHKKSRKDNAERVSHYTPHEKEINMGDVEFPVPHNKVSTLEALNDIRINVYGYSDSDIYPLQISSRRDKDCCNLLYISNEGKNHYCLIRSLPRLVYGLSKHKGSCHICYQCLHRFAEKKTLEKHTPYCIEHAPQRIEMPEEGKNILKFTNVGYQHTVPYIIYCDFESLLKPISSCQPSTSTSFSQNISLHEPCGYAYVVVDVDGRAVKPPTVYRGADAVDHFLQNIMLERDELAPKFHQVKPIRMTAKDKKAFQQAKDCEVCGEALGTNRVRDHCHLTGHYRAALHKQCNINFKLKKMIPIVFHNLKNYDSHHLMQGVGKLSDHNINVIGSTLEKYISFNLRKKEGASVSLQFIDSYQFLSTSLDELVKGMDPEEFNILKQCVPDEKEWKLLLRKGVYPYEYMDSWEKFVEKKLPPSAAFFSYLTQECITTEDYEHAEKVWDGFKMETMGEYHDLYLKSDVLLLADVFQQFRQMCQNSYHIDPAHLMTAPGLSWQAALKESKQEIELLTDPDMLLFVERGIRGGISMISKRYSQANNTYVGNYDTEKPPKHLIYLDANNLYGWAMSQPLPYGGFAWMDPEEFTESKILKLKDDGPQGYILEVDLEYPSELHDHHNDYPLAPERVKILRSMLSPYAEDLVDNTLNNHFISCEKLVPNLNNKTRYTIHYRNLKLYLELGMKLTQVHKVLKFSQSPWLKSYIDLNTEKRKDATTAFAKAFFKLLNNALFGKTLENLRKRVNIQLTNCSKQAAKLISSPAYKGSKIFFKDLVAVERVKTNVKMNRPLYVGFCVLELSKWLMYDFHYKHIKKLYGEKAQLLFTDTDSLAYEIETFDLYKDLKQHTELYDFSDYPSKHPLQSNENKKRIGCFKDEFNGYPIQEFIGLRPKMYSLLTKKDDKIEEKMVAKGVSKRIMGKKITHAHYKECLLELKQRRDLQRRFTHDGHLLYTLQQNKVTLSPLDDKRYLKEDGIHSYAYGHYAI